MPEGRALEPVMEPVDVVQLLAVLLAIALVVGGLRFRTELLRLFDQLDRELRRFAVYSAETTRGNEAEFIRDQLPTKLPLVAALIIAIVLGAAVWWLMR
jgi:hypothetical protein